MILPITIDLVTRSRYNTTLPLTLQSILNQSQLPTKILVYDDTPNKIDMRTVPLYQYIINNTIKMGIEFEVVFGTCKGQVVGHQLAIDKSNTDFIYRIDDDEIMPYNLLEKLYEDMMSDPMNGAIAPLVHDPNTRNIPTVTQNPDEFVNKITEILYTQNFQWIMPADRTVKYKAEHLFSSFLFDRKKCNGYCTELSQVGHREETIFSHDILRKGFKLVIDPSVIVQHYKNPEGGIRDKNVTNEMFQKDEETFKRKLISWNIQIDKKKIIILNCGIGDHFAFKNHVKGLIENIPDITIASAFPNIFFDIPNIKIMGLQPAYDVLGKTEAESHNIYTWCIKREWKPENGNLVEMYRRFLNETFNIAL